MQRAVAALVVVVSVARKASQANLVTSGRAVTETATVVEIKTVVETVVENVKTPRRRCLRA